MLTSIALVLALIVPLLAGAIWSGERSAAEQRDRYGSTVVARLAAEASEPLLAGDRIALAVLVGEFTALEGIATAAVYGADNRLMAAADGAIMSPAEYEGARGARVFVAQITLQDSIAGYARLALDDATFAADHLPLVTLGLALAVLAVAAARVRLEPVTDRLAELRERVGEGLDRRDQTAERDAAPIVRLPVIEGADAPPRTRAEDGPGSLYLVVVNLFNQVSLSAAERAEVVDDCDELLERVCRLYGGRRERLPGTGLALVLDALADEGDHAFQAVCVALLAARVFEGLNLERRRDGRVPLALRIGVERVVDEGAESALDAKAVAEACPDTLGRAVTLSALARERAIVVSDGVRQRCAQPSRLAAETVASPALRAAGEESAWLVRDLAEGYRGLLDRQAQLLLGAS
ncbi:MAG: hypothetical protein V2J24_10505 [Pseudomonadales bacterium]|jgi:uncharacterized membrane protein affecting hemolysin expression|nr:hypothetical protein [Pseudomonadales bacterium]